MKSIKFFLFGFIFLILTGLVSAVYSQNNFDPFPRSSFLANQEDMEFDPLICQEGQDFIIQIAPGGCSPAPVRSDLLEEQNVPVFCELQAIKVNPLIEIEAIESIGIRGEYPREISTVGFYPNYAALGENKKLNNMMWDNIGYAAIELRKQSNESALTNCVDSKVLGLNMGEVCWVQGNLTASIKYDIHNAFGITDRNFYLPLINDDEFDKTQGRYGFFENRGYLRAEDIQVNSASIAVYSGRYEGLFDKSEEGEVSKKKLWKRNLNIGELGPKVYLPGLDCFSAVQFRLDALEGQDTRARLKINSEIIEVKEGEEFLGGKCRVTNLDKNGLNQNVEIYCETENFRGERESDTFDLRIEPSIKLNINGKEVKANVGDLLYEEAGKYVYLGYVGTKKEGNQAKDLKAFLVALDSPEPGNRLNDDQITTAALLDDYYSFEEGNLRDITKFYQAGALQLYKLWGVGENYRYLEFNKPKNFKGMNVGILDFGDGENYVIFNQTLKEYYGKAISNYENIKNNFRGEKYPENEVVTLGERALNDLIILANKLLQKQNLKQYCDEFKADYEKSTLEAAKLCGGIPSYSNKGVSTREMLIGGDFKEISFQGIYEPTFKEYGTEVVIRRGNEFREVHLRKGDQIYLRSLFEEDAPQKGDFIRLEEIKDKENAVFYFDLQEKSILSKTGDILGSEKRILKKEKLSNFGSDYIFNLKKVNLERVAKVSLHSSINYDRTEAKFGFKIGVEKRAIQLSPEKTKERIDTVNGLLETLNSISENLGTVVEGMKTACLVTGSALALKNLISGIGGETIARQEVMRGEDGWYEECADKKYQNEVYSSIDDCIFSNADKIDAEVKLLIKGMDEQNERKKEIQEIEGVVTKGGLFEQDRVDQREMAKYVSEDTLKSLDNESVKNLEINGKKIDLGVIEKALDEDGLYKYYDIDDLNKIQLYSNLLVKDPPNKIKYEKRLFTILNQVQINSKNLVVRENWAKDLGVNSKDIDLFKESKKSKSLDYTGRKKSDIKITLAGVQEDDPIYITQTDLGNRYFIVLDDSSGTNKYPIKRDGEENKKLMVFDETGKRVEKTNIFENVYFEKSDRKSYENKFAQGEFKVTYYERDPYKGLPAIVSFDEKNGWYAYVKQTVPALGELRTYDESGKTNIFYLCNVGENGLIERLQDKCQMINVGLPGKSYEVFSGLDKDETSVLIHKANQAIEEAKFQYDAGVREVRILKRNVGVGSPEINLPALECIDIMSPKECQILFNLCDPVMCPRTRCDLGGKYPVDNVVQSGIIGSIALCLPNFNEGIYVPVCLTGVKAGIDGLMSVGESYKSCLQESLDTGKTIGICDQINSIYACEFLWRQGLPFIKMAIPTLLGTIFGEGSRGGGEYLNVEAAWENTQDSVNYFTNFYAANAFEAFKARSQEEVGTEICKQSISIAFPGFGNSLELLTQADSPPMVNANFDATPFTTVTDPPRDHYKISYHIYAGKDRGANYRVYLRGGGGSYYQTLGGRNVASGYLAVGESASESIDRIYESGYRELCVQVNNEEYCGFGMVSTDFAVNYVQDQYALEQSTEKNVNSEKECVSGTASWYSLLNPNVQAGFENLISPEIYNEGIIRICGSENPGIGNDINYPGEHQRWVDVGYCDEKNLRCWVDQNSLENVFKFNASRAEAIGDLSDKVLEDFEKQKLFLSDKEFTNKLEEIDGNDNLFKRLDLIEEIFDKVFGNNKKAYLYFLKGGIYGNLTLEGWKESQPGEEINEIDCEFSGELRKDVLDCTMFLEGKYLPGAEAENYKFVDAVYSKLNAERNCVYSDNQEKEYSIGTGIKIGTSPFNVYPQKCNLEDNDQTYKFDRLISGSVVSYYSEEDANKRLQPNHALFIGWADRDAGIASLFGLKSIKDKRYTFFTKDLKDKFHPIYSIWNPALSEEVYTPEDQKEIEDKAKEDILDQSKDLVAVGEKIGEDFVSSKYFFDENNAVWYDDEFCFQYFEKSWHWRDANCDESQTYFRGGRGAQLSEISASWFSPSSQQAQNLDTEFRGMVRSLDGRDFVEGLEVLATKTINPSENYYLQVGNVKLDINGVFWIEIPQLDSQIFAKYISTEGGWNWNQWGNDRWVQAYKIELFDNPQRINEDYKKLIFNLEGRNFGQGIASLFERKTFDFGQIVPVGQGLGNEILSVAQSKIGGDTFRIEGGEKVFNSVCATFVSNVLIEAGALSKFTSCGIESITERDAVIELKDLFEKEGGGYVQISEPDWKSNLKEGDIIIWGCDGQSFCKTGKNDLQHITIFEKYEGNRFGIIHDGGEFDSEGKIRPIERKSYGIGSSWFMTHVYRHVGIDEEVEDKKKVSKGTIEVVNEKNEPVKDEVIVAEGKKVESSEGIAEVETELDTLRGEDIGDVVPSYNFHVCVDNSCQELHSSDGEKYAFSSEPADAVKVKIESLGISDFTITPKKEVVTDIKGEIEIVEVEVADTIVVEDEQGEPVVNTEFKLHIGGLGPGGSFGSSTVVKTNNGGEVDLAGIIRDDGSLFASEELDILGEAYMEFYGLEGKYGDHKNLVDKWCDYSQQEGNLIILSEEECNDIDGGEWYDIFNREGNMKQVREKIEEKMLFSSGGRDFLDNLIASSGGEVEEKNYDFTREDQIKVGEKIKEVAGDVKKMYAVDENLLIEQTGANSFECLILQVAMKESSFKFCKDGSLNGDPFYCEGIDSEIHKGDKGKSYGVMQVNSYYHSDDLKDLVSLEGNVDVGVRILAGDSLLDAQRNYPQGYRYCNGETYFDWTAALRFYHGKERYDGKACTENDPNYVQEVINQKKDVGNLFPECAGGDVPEYTSLFSTEKTILIDPGHCDRYGGSLAVDGVTKEQDLNLIFSKELKSSLESRGYEVILTREGDSCVNEERRDLNLDGKVNSQDERRARINLANSLNPQLFISIHFNSLEEGENIKGSELIAYSNCGISEANDKIDLCGLDYYDVNPDSLGYVREIEEFFDYQGISSRSFAGDYGILDNKRNSFLIEVDYISNSDSLAVVKTSSGRKKYIDSIVDGISSRDETVIPPMLASEQIENIPGSLVSVQSWENDPVFDSMGNTEFSIELSGNKYDMVYSSSDCYVPTGFTGAAITGFEVSTCPIDAVKKYPIYFLEHEGSAIVWLGLDSLEADFLFENERKAEGTYGTDENYFLGYLKNLGSTELMGRHPNLDNLYSYFQQNGYPLVNDDILIKGFKKNFFSQKITDKMKNAILTAKEGIKNSYGVNVCDCGDFYSCMADAYYLEKYSKEYNVDPLLGLSLIIQESECDQNIESFAEAKGLFQIIEPTYNDVCTSLGQGDFENVVGEENSANNIDCGLKILKAKINEFKNGVRSSWSYNNVDAFKEMVNECILEHPKYGEYTLNNAGLRAYNGWGCVEPYADLNYAEKIGGYYDAFREKFA